MSGSPILGQILGQYKIIEKIGAGGMGEVYRAQDTHLERDVALKVLPPSLLNDESARKRFRKEALALSRLSHPNIATIFDFATQDHVDFLAMEFIAGEPLNAKVARGPLPLQEVLEIGLQIADAMAAAHARDVIHRDLKPSNVMVTPEGRVKILDFGLATLLRSAGGDSDLTLSLTEGNEPPGLAGTLPYMSPEQLRGRPADARRDIWACGVVLHEMVRGKQPFEGKTGFELSSAILQQTPPPLPAETPPGLADAVAKCLAKEPGRRYQRAGELQAALSAVRSGQTGYSAPPPERPRHMAGILAGIVLALVAGAILVAWVLHRGKNSASKVAGHEKRLAVLPVAPMAEGGVSRAFSNGLIEMLTTRLTQLAENRELQVIPASEIRSSGVSSLQQAYEQFGVNVGLEFTFQSAGDQIRVSYVLIDPKTHQELRGDTITAPASDPFTLQDKVVESVVSALQIELRPDEQQSLTAHGTLQPAAYDFYLQGRGYLQDFDKPEKIDNAIVVFNHALERDPNYARAYAGLGEAYWHKYLLSKNSQWVDQAESACQRSVHLQDDQGDGHVCLGLLFTGTGKYQDAVAQYQRALELDPTDDDAYTGLADAYQHLGRLDEAENTFKKAIRLRPNDSYGYGWLGSFYKDQARYSEAAEMFQRVIDLEPDSFVGYSNLGSIYVLEGRNAEALPKLEKSIEIRPTDEELSNLGTAYFALRRFSDAAHAYEEAVKLSDRNFTVWGNLGDAYYWAPGLRDKAPAAYRKAISIGKETLRVNPRDADTLAYLAQDYAMLGQRKEALALLQRALDISPKNPDTLLVAATVHIQLGDTTQALQAMQDAIAAGLPANQLRDAPNFDRLRDDPRFQKLVNGP
jgi:eukaryotic-like serine/threonine-protein kinase